jgi:colanic acid/amylovoran biosynthesis glycosyltransferase
VPRAFAANEPVDAVGHTVLAYLPRSCTFIYTTIRFQTAFRPVVLAERTQNLSEFPVEPLHRLVRPNSSIARRAARRLWAHAHGFRRTYDHRLSRVAGRAGCVLMHAHFGWAGCAALPARRRLGVPLVTTFYGRDLSDSRGLDYDRLFSEGSLFICEGPTMGEHLAELGCPSRKIRIVRIGVDTTQFPFAPKRRSRPLVLVQACRFVEKKGVDLSIRSFAAARPRLGPSELWLVGDGELRPELELLATRLGVSGSVHFLGMLLPSEYREVIRRAHICIQPSRVASDGDTEGGAPTVLLEMQAIGVPVASTRHADIPFVVAEPDRLTAEGDVDGLAEELIRLSRVSEAEWTVVANRGRAFVESRHDAPVVATELEAVYREAMAASDGASVQRGVLGAAIA